MSGDRRAFALPHPLTLLTACIVLAAAFENMAEEIIALVPVLLLVTRRLGFDAITAVAR
jgi:uncharacterized ion transporter superfamily protein YfcC